VVEFEREVVIERGNGFGVFGGRAHIGAQETVLVRVLAGAGLTGSGDGTARFGSVGAGDDAFAFESGLEPVS